MRIGDLNTRVEIEQLTQKQDDVLNLPAKWGKYENAWCSVVAEPGTETARDNQTNSNNVVTLETHWSPKLAAATTEMRIKLSDGRVLPIRSIVNERMQNRVLIITCEETK